MTAETKLQPEIFTRKKQPLTPLREGLRVVVLFQVTSLRSQAGAGSGALQHSPPGTCSWNARVLWQPPTSLGSYTLGRLTLVFSAGAFLFCAKSGAGCGFWREDAAPGRQ